MNAKTYSRLAALIFAIVAVLQLARAMSGWPRYKLARHFQSQYGQVGLPALLPLGLPGSVLTHLEPETSRALSGALKCEYGLASGYSSHHWCQSRYRN